MRGLSLLKIELRFSRWLNLKDKALQEEAIQDPTADLVVLAKKLYRLNLSCVGLQVCTHCSNVLWQSEFFVNVRCSFGRTVPPATEP